MESLHSTYFTLGDFKVHLWSVKRDLKENRVPTFTQNTKGINFLLLQTLFIGKGTLRFMKGTSLRSGYRDTHPKS